MEGQAQIGEEQDGSATCYITPGAQEGHHEQAYGEARQINVEVPPGRQGLHLIQQKGVLIVGDKQKPFRQKGRSRTCSKLFIKLIEYFSVDVLFKHMHEGVKLN